MTDKHVRQQIREAFKALLTGLPTTGANVFTGRAYAIDESERPGLIIGVAEDPGESSDVDTIGDAVTLARQVPITVEAYANGETVLDTLDTIAVEIEQRLAGGEGLRHLVNEMTLVGTRQRVSADDKTRAGEMRMTYRVAYRTTDAAPQIATP